MKFIFLIVLGAFLAFNTFSQCLTDFTKLLPQPSIDNTLDFGRSIAMYDDYLAIGIPNSDSLGRLTGIVHVYKKNNSTWEKVAVLAPRIPSNALQFGWSLKMSRDYLLVGATGGGGKVYLFKKPSSGWGSDLLWKYQNEHTIFTVSNSSSFGVSHNNTIDISEDQRTIAITDQDFVVSSIPPSRYGAVFIYRSDPLGNWSTQNYTQIIAPEDDAPDFGKGGVEILGNRIATTTPFSPSGNGRIYIFQDPSGDFSNPVLEAKLSPSYNPQESYLLDMSNLIFTEDGIFIPAVVGADKHREFQIIYFEKPSSGIWSDSERTCSIDPDGNTSVPTWWSPIRFSVVGNDFYVSSRDSTGTGFIHLFKKGNAGWCNPQRELIATQPAPSYPSVNSFGVVMTSNQDTNVAVGFVSHPANELSQVSLKVFSKNTLDLWESQLIYPTKKSTAGHFYGTSILGFDDYLFVGAPNDGTVKPNGGKVSIYHKNGTNWEEEGAILPPITNQRDNGFGRAIASNGKYMAIGGNTGDQPFGRVLVYKNTNNDWSRTELVQEIEFPDTLIVYAYGDHMAMNDDWLVIPYVQNAPARNMLAIFKFNGNTWDFKQIVEMGFGSLFAKESTIDVDVEGNIMAFGGLILELDNDDVWRSKYLLSPSDPEPIQIAPDFTHWISNGSLFGFSMDITDDGNTIFIGAPTKDHEGTWDVGAVYVYAKKPGESWSSRTETAKIIPRVKEERELFGYTLKGLHNTLIVGAPGSDYDINGGARNKPGRAYVFQSSDYFRQDVVGLVDFTGDSFVKDYFGIAVNLDESDFFIGASIEDIDNAKLSGSVYVTPTPPIIKLVPPVCSDAETIDLFGYPFNGVWAGPGLIDVNKGIFDPKVAGPGVHEFTYTTASCAYQGKLRIQIEDPPGALLGVNPQHTVCMEGNVNIPINVQPQTGAYYLWYYREKPTHDFESLEIRSSSMIATNRGEYQAKVYNQSCQSFSPVVTILDEHIDVTVVPPAISCAKSNISISLSAEPLGGQWSGPGVVNNTFIPANLPAGSYPITYTYTSLKGCSYQRTTAADVVPGFNPVIQREQGNLCSEGNVVLKVQGNPPADLQFIWQMKEPNGSSFTNLEESDPSITITDHGTYQIIASNETCTRTSLPITIDDQLFVILIPEEKESIICNGETLTFSISYTGSDNFSDWYFAEEENGIQTRLNSNGNNLIANKSGYYQAHVKSGICSAWTDVKHLFVHPADSIFIPNVFTPNGDGWNDKFEAWTTMDDLQIDVLNRYGQNIYQVHLGKGWTGDGFPTGIYYWQANYNTCLGERKTLKGYVHLLR